MAEAPEDPQNFPISGMSGARLAVSPTPSPGLICPVFALGVSSEPGQEMWNQPLASQKKTEWHEFAVHMLGSRGMRVNKCVQLWKRMCIYQPSSKAERGYDSKISKQTVGKCV